MADRLTDGWFENWTSATDATSWTEELTGTSTVNRDATEKAAGSYCLRIEVDASANYAQIYQAVTLVPSRKYRVSVKHKASAAGVVSKLYLNDTGVNQYLKSDGTWTATPTPISLTNSTSWRTTEIEFSAHASYSAYYFICRGDTASSTVYFDECRLESRDTVGFLWDNEWDSGTLTASSNATNFPANNTRHRWYKRTWRSSNLAAPDYLLLDAGANVAAEMCVIRYDNFNSTATVAIQANTADNWVNPAVNNAMTLNNSTMVQLWTSSQSYRYWRLSMNDANNPSNYVEVGRVLLGTVFEPTRNPIIGGGMREQEDPSTITFSDGGQISSIQRTKYKTGQIEFNLLPASDKSQFENLQANVGYAKSFVFCQDLGDPWQETYYVELTTFEIIPRWAFQYDIRIGLREAR